jgi:hypothetical protein
MVSHSAKLNAKLVDPGFDEFIAACDAGTFHVAKHRPGAVREWRRAATGRLPVAMSTERDELTHEERRALLDLVHWEIENRKQPLSAIRAHSTVEAYPA